MALSPVLLVNPAAGNGKGQQVLRLFSPFCHTESIAFPKLSEQLEGLPETDVIIVAGGDGTVSSILSHPSLPQNPTKTVLPLGTANDLGRELGLSGLEIPKNIPRFLDSIPTWPSTSLAVWQLTIDGKHHRFCNYCSLGFEGEVVHTFTEWRRKHSGRPSRWQNRLQYAWSALASSRRSHSWSLEHSPNEEPTPLRGHTLIFSNISSYLGFASLATGNRYSDKKLEVTSITGVTKYLRLIGQGLFNLKLLPAPAQISENCVLKWRHGDVRIQADGEYIGVATAGELKIQLLGFVKVSGPKVSGA
jgi:diacylglycerol kinase family enzyme